MKELIILSGKGGTGKTTVAGTFAALATRKVMVDCDVDAANLHLLLQPETLERHPFDAGQHAEIDPLKCSRCGLCQEICRFGAISDYRVSPTFCEGCGFCARVCPETAIALRSQRSGYWFRARSRYGTLIHAELGIARENSGQLVALLRRQARELAAAEAANWIISDGPPGTACAAISSLSGADLALLVTEPTVSGNHDLTRVIELCTHFKVPAVVCINKWDVNRELAVKIREFCWGQQIPVIAEIDYDISVSQAICSGQPAVAAGSSKIREQLEGLYRNTMATL